MIDDIGDPPSGGKFWVMLYRGDRGGTWEKHSVFTTEARANIFKADLLENEPIFRPHLGLDRCIIVKVIG